MKLFKSVFAVTLSLFLFGCASGAKMENMVFHGDKKSYPDEIQGNMEVGEVSGGKKTNPAWKSEIDNEAFSSAVKESLKFQGLYSDSGRFQLEVKMLKVDQPLFGLDLEVTTHVRYILRNKADGSVVLDETVIAPHTAGVSDAFVAVERLRLANEGSAKKNIEGMLYKLSQLEINPSEISLAK